jgi:hypothetical protein
VSSSATNPQLRVGAWVSVATPKCHIKQKQKQGWHACVSFSSAGDSMTWH